MGWMCSFTFRARFVTCSVNVGRRLRGEWLETIMRENNNSGFFLLVEFEREQQIQYGPIELRSSGKSVLHFS